MTLDALRRMCLEFPGVTEDVKWGKDLVFSVGEKMFCVTGTDHIPISASFKAGDDAFEELASRPGFSPAPYLARHKWIVAEDISRIPEKELRDHIARSYALVREKLPARLKKLLDSGS